MGMAYLPINWVCWGQCTSIGIVCSIHEVSGDELYASTDQPSKRGHVFFPSNSDLPTWGDSSPVRVRAVKTGVFVPRIFRQQELRTENGVFGRPPTQEVCSISHKPCFAAPWCQIRRHFRISSGSVPLQLPKRASTNALRQR